MRLFDNMKIAVKLPLLMILVALATLVLTGLSSYKDARSALRQEGAARLETLAETRRTDLQAWFEKLGSDLLVFSESATTRRALAGFKTSWELLPGDPAEAVARLYVTGNASPEGRRYLLDDAGDGSQYSKVHQIYNQSFVSIYEKYGYYDIFLIDPEGNVLYSVFKEGDYGSNLLTGPLKDTAFAGIVRNAIGSNERDRVEFADFERYAPSGDVPAAFLATRVVHEDGRLMGVLAVQIPVAQIDGIMQRATGLGRTGETYLVGPDMVMRSNLRLSGEPTILVREAATDAARAALAGAPMSPETVGITGDPVAAATTQVVLDGRVFGIVVEQALSELYAPAAELAGDLVRDVLVIMVFVGLIGFLLARSLARPMVRVGEAMGRISDKDYATGVPGTARGDEIGYIATTLEKFRDALADAEVAARDGAFRGAAFEGSSASLMMVDRDFRIIYANSAVSLLLKERADGFRRMDTAFDPDKILGQSMDFFDAKPESIRGMMRDPSKLPIHVEIKVDEARLTLDINAVTMKEVGLVGYVVEWRDVTEQRMNCAVLDAMDRNQSMAEFDVRGRFVRANTNFLDMVGISAEGLANRMHDQIVRYDAGLAKERGVVWDRLMTGESVFGRFWLDCEAGGEAALDGGFTPVRDRSGQVLKVVLMGVNVTEAQLALRMAEEERKAMAEAQARVVDSLRVGLSRLSDGDLTARIDLEFSTEYEELRSDFNAAVARLSDAIRAVIDNANSIRSEAVEISNAADDLSRRTEKQAATLEQTAAALDELTSSVQSAAAGASEANRVVIDARASAEASGEVVREAVAAMGEIESSSEKISRIISVIDDIAFQTNLLALNAGVEAARAGEAGRGFAVVASEVRALAQRSSEAAREINALISTSSGHVKRGVDLVGQTGSALKKIVTSVTDISSRVSEISSSAQEQSAGLAEINIAVNQLDQVTQQNAAMFEETTAASHSLTREAEALSETTARFQVAGATVVSSETFPSRGDAPVKAALRSVGNTALAPASDAAADDWEDF
ncbi:methyl-accepting chemotaxis protein [Ostreiculturibacter nitratireducens]|uniref:methyl-accepting chemotaxis protein n=1 Tax=Ostreiculturibacter nitratireducens TaxID=3075226 RepID=UPI0031B5761B